MRFFIETAVVIIFAITAIVLYQQYWDNIRYALFGDETQYNLYIDTTAITVSVADNPEKRVLGLSGTPSLGELEGKLFIYDTDAKHGIWMKDMLFPIDIIWIDKNLQIVHIAENVAPSTYPQVFLPQVDARFVLEMNAFIVSSLKIQVGDRLTIPPSILPEDIRKNLQK